MRFGLTSLVLSIGLLLGGCETRAQMCAEDLEAEPPRVINSNNLCGCESAPITCGAGQSCFDGDCCSLESDGLNEESCGCSQACDASDTCKIDEASGYYCCDPSAPPETYPADRDACGCGPACDEDYEACNLQADETYACDCVPEKNTENSNDCGCNGACAGDEICIEGECLCNPNNIENETNDNDCGCTGEVCVDDSHCREGRCACPEPGEEYCDHECQPASVCECVIEQHQSDAANCGCGGPCAATETCDEGICVDACDATLHYSDVSNCGCSGPCNPDESCEEGVCAAICDPEEHDTDPTDCGCQGECEYDETCEPCDSTESCVAQCTCDPMYHQSDNANCGCEGTCGSGDYCDSGECVCNPLSHLSDSNDCGCDGACTDWSTSSSFGVPEVCSLGSCGCPTGYYPLHVYDCIDSSLTSVYSRNGMCVASDPTVSGMMCQDGYTYCTYPDHCAYEYDGDCGGRSMISRVYCEE